MSGVGFRVHNSQGIYEPQSNSLKGVVWGPM